MRHAASFLPSANEGVVHGIPHELGTIFQAFLAQVREALLGNREQKAGNVIGAHTIHLFRIRQRPRAITRLHMSYRNVDLCGSQGTGKRGIGVSIQKNHIGLFFEQGLLQRNQHGGSHAGMRASRNAQIVIGLRYSQLVEESLGHVVVKMLARMNERFLNPSPQLARNNSRLDELRPCPHDARNLQCLLLIEQPICTQPPERQDPFAPESPRRHLPGAVRFPRERTSDRNQGTRPPLRAVDARIRTPTQNGAPARRA